MSRVAFLDFEASSAGVAGHPTAVGLAIADETTQCIRTAAWIVAPHPDWQFADGHEWDPVAAEITGLDRERCEREGHQPATVARALNTGLRTRSVYISAIQDKSWCDVLFDGGDPPVVRSFALHHVSRIPKTADGEPETHERAWADAMNAVLAENIWTRHDPAHDAGRLADAYLRYQAAVVAPSL